MLALARRSCGTVNGIRAIGRNLWRGGLSAANLRADSAES